MRRCASFEIGCGPRGDPQQVLAQRGQRQSFGAPVKQAGPCRLFKPCDPAADRRVMNSQMFGRAAHRSHFSNGQERFQIFPVHFSP